MLHGTNVEIIEAQQASLCNSYRNINFKKMHNLVCILLGNALASDCCMPRRDVYALQYPSHRGEAFLISNFRRVLNLVCILLGNAGHYTTEYIQDSKHGESLKSKMHKLMRSLMMV